MHENVKRYEPCCCCGEDQNGWYIAYDDYTAVCDQLTAAHKVIKDLEDKAVKQSTLGAVFDPDGSIGFAWAAERFGDDEPLTAAEHIAALEAMGAVCDSVKMLVGDNGSVSIGARVLILPPEMRDAR